MVDEAVSQAYMGSVAWEVGCQKRLQGREVDMTQIFISNYDSHIVRQKSEETQDWPASKSLAAIDGRMGFPEPHAIPSTSETEEKKREFETKAPLLSPQRRRWNKLNTIWSGLGTGGLDRGELQDLPQYHLGFHT